MSYKIRTIFIAVVAASSLLLAACGGNDEDNTSGDRPESEQDREIKWTQCMRDNGVDIEDSVEGSGNAVTVDEGGMEDFNQAETACEEWAPESEEGDVSDEEFQELMLTYAQCMRDEGVEDFKDPGANGSMAATSMEDMEDPVFQKALETCEKIFADLG